MESATFRKWLTERGCRFDRHEHQKQGDGQVIVTVHGEGPQRRRSLLEARARSLTLGWCAGRAKSLALNGRSCQGRRVKSEAASRC